MSTSSLRPRNANLGLLEGIIIGVVKMIFDKLFRRHKYKQIPTHQRYGISKNGEVCNLETGYILKLLMGRSDKAKIKLDGKFELISDLIDITYGRGKTR